MMQVGRRKAATLRALMDRNLNLITLQRKLLEEMILNEEDHSQQIEMIQDQVCEGIDATQDEIDEGFNDENIDTQIIFVERMSHDRFDPGDL